MLVYVLASDAFGYVGSSWLCASLGCFPWVRPPLLRCVSGDYSFLPICWATGELIVKERIAMGHTSRVLISSVKAADFLKYKDFLRLPASQPSSTRAKTNVTETNHTGQAFYRHYGDWADGAKGLLINHCDIDQLTMVMNKKIDTTYCGMCTWIPL